MKKRFQVDLLVGRRVYDTEGRKLGRVGEIQLVRAGEEYVVEGLLIGVGGLAERLGLAPFLERLKRHFQSDHWSLEDHIVYWEQIKSIEPKRIRLKVRQAAIETVKPEH